MTLEQLGEEYLRQEMIVRERIDIIRPHLYGIGLDRSQVESRLRSLYKSARDCHRIGVHLKYYYKEVYTDGTEDIESGYTGERMR